MYTKFVFYLFIIIFLSIIQIGFISGLPGNLQDVNLFLVLMVFLLGFWGLEKTLFISLGVGLFLDFYSFYPFGFYIVAVFITIIFSDFLFINFLTNRSLYSFLALTAFAHVLFLFLLHFFLFFFYFLTKQNWVIIFDFSFFVKHLEVLLFDLVLSFFFFYIFNFFSKKLKPVFLDTKKL